MSLARFAGGTLGGFVFRVPKGPDINRGEEYDERYEEEDASRRGGA